jgi:Flp pilus assembly secretin CpaC
MNFAISLSLSGPAHAARSLAGGLVVALAFISGPARAEDVINVSIDQAKVIQLPDKTSTVIVGNPIVADVTMLKGNGKMILTGKGFGETNLIALDASGGTLGESVIRVTSQFRGLIVQRGLDRESYTCNPSCQPTVFLGDTAKYMGEVSGQIQAHNALSSGK